MTVDTETQVVLGAEVAQDGTDGSQLKPAIEQLERRYGKKPKQALVDGGYINTGAIGQLEEDGVEIYAPPKKPSDPQRGRYQVREKDSCWVARWRVRMGSPEAQQIYRQRASTIECVNAQMRNRGLRGFVVRGLRKVKAVTLWFALAHNLMKTVRLQTAEVA
jgi:IS5 family transposase